MNYLNIDPGDELRTHHFYSEEKTTGHGIQANLISSSEKIEIMPPAGKIIMTDFGNQKEFT